MARNKRKISNRGAVLVLAIIVMVILFVVVTQYAFTTKIEHRLAENSEGNLEIYYATRAVMSVATALLAEDDTPLVDSETDMWGENYEYRTEMALYARTLIGVGVNFTIRDSSRFINLLGLNSKNATVRKDTEKLLANLAIAIESSEQCEIDDLGERIRDFLDTNQEGDFEYEGNLNANPITQEQILDLPEVEYEQMDRAYYGYRKKTIFFGWGTPTEDEGEQVRGLKDCTVIWGDATSAPPRININTAPREVLVAVILMNNAELSVDSAREDADRIIEHRDETEESESEEGGEDKKYFASFGKIKADLEEIECDYAANSSRWFTIMAAPMGKSQFFIVTMNASKGTFKKEIRIVLERKIKMKGPAQIITHMWREIGAHIPLKEEDRRE